MSAPNFKTMADFPLIVAEPHYRKACPVCGLGNCDDADTCEDCGADLTDVQAEFDDLAGEVDYENMSWYAKKANEKQDFYTVTVESGYYTGLQFYVTEKGDSLDDVTHMSDEECQWEYGRTRAEQIEMFTAAAETVRKELDCAKDELGLTELSCIGVFSNGEAVYRKVA